MKLVIFGLTVSSSWSNGHATLWRGLISALVAKGYRVVFFEQDLPFYSPRRDLTELPQGGELVLYSSWQEVLPRARRELAGADVGLVTSYCPDGVAASRLVLDSNVPVRCFYDLDTPHTLERVQRGERVEYLLPNGLGAFDLVLSYTGGRSLTALREVLGARHVAPLYGSVDPGMYYPVPPKQVYWSDFSYLGPHEEALERFFLEPARRLPRRRFVLGGERYPTDFAWPPNLFLVQHLPPTEHPAFYSSSLLTLNVTRGPMAELGYCPSGRLFESAACGTPVLSDSWEGLGTFFRIGEEILVARSTEEALEAISLPAEQLMRIGRAARERALTEHTSDHRAEELVRLLEAAHSPYTRPPRRPEPPSPQAGAFSART
ncbi:CgeB family protein [Hyalangium rubrum]|uniref:Glycosyltransferase n=1 Tax=Hyalangium rubrum TaxID=3103134 RepID=A0ABU5HHA1_9BACT|nr:glycosyltransferase [Hyalangium sp. s54d21]MDY7232635.1 glycosyltransferase [Hyalangium sp. s54d21]